MCGQFCTLGLDNSVEHTIVESQPACCLRKVRGKIGLFGFESAKLVYCAVDILEHEDRGARRLEQDHGPVLIRGRRCSNLNLRNASCPSNF